MASEERKNSVTYTYAALIFTILKPERDTVLCALIGLLSSYY